MLGMTAREIAAVTGGELIGGACGDETVTGVARIDSRAVHAGDLFAAFSGENVDGHDFVDAAHTAGAALSVVSAPVQQPAVLVTNVQDALWELARHQVQLARTRQPEFTVVAITGSAGKTGTKDLLGAMLSTAGDMIAPPGSFNNELGLPLTVLAISDHTRYLVLEMGARNIGHIAELTSIARPDIAVVLNVGSAHLGEFGSVDAIATAKGELVEALAPTGRAILNANDQRVFAMAERSTAPVTTFGIRNADVRAHNLDLDEQARARFDMVVPEGLEQLRGAPVTAGTFAMRPDLLGEHQAMNVLAAATAALVAGVEPQAIAAAMDGVSLASPHRMQRHQRGGVTVIDDAYNANPDSMKQALRTLRHIGQGRRCFAVLGEMLELGPDTVMLHDEIGRWCVRLNIDYVIAVGPGAAPIHHGASLEGSFGGESLLVDTVDEARALLERMVAPGDVVLLKSSRDSGVRAITAPLLDYLAAQENAADNQEEGARA